MKCRYCGGSFRIGAKVCPECKKPTSTTIEKVGAIGLILGLVVYALYPSSKEDQTPTASAPAVTAQQAAAPEAASAASSPYDEAAKLAIIGAMTLRKGAHNPERFELVYARYSESAVCYEYRAENGFGALRVGRAVATVTPMNLINQDGKGFTRAWSKHCTTLPEKDARAYFNYYIK